MRDQLRECRNRGLRTNVSHDRDQCPAIIVRICPRSRTVSARHALYVASLSPLSFSHIGRGGVSDAQLSRGTHCTPARHIPLFATRIPSRDQCCSPSPTTPAGSSARQA